MEHLIDADVAQHLTPPSDCRRLHLSEAFVRPRLEAERDVQVLAHDHVLELSRLRQQVPQMLAALDDENWFSHQPCRVAWTRLLDTAPLANAAGERFTGGLPLST